MDYRSLDIDDWEDYTGDVTNIISEVRNFTESSSCCDYEFQILDKFCASQSAVSVIDPVHERVQCRLMMLFL